MSDLKVNNRIFNYPDPGSEPGWGKDATGWAKEVTEVVDSLSGSGSIFETQADILNDVLNEEVPGLIFNPSISETNRIIYTVSRTTDDVKLQEHGVLNIDYIDADSEYVITREITNGDYTEIEFSVASNGQVTYTTTAILGLNYQGSIKFKSISTIK